MNPYLRWRPGFAAAINPRFYTIEYLDDLIVTGKAHLWTSETAAIVAAIKTFPTGLKALEGVCATGDLDGIKELIRTALGWAREQGCECGLIESRDGWVKALRSEGWTIFQTMIVKDL